MKKLILLLPAFFALYACKKNKADTTTKPECWKCDYYARSYFKLYNGGVSNGVVYDKGDSTLLRTFDTCSIPQTEVDKLKVSGKYISSYTSGDTMFMLYQNNYCNKK